MKPTPLIDRLLNVGICVALGIALMALIQKCPSAEGAPAKAPEPYVTRDYPIYEGRSLVVVNPTRKHVYVKATCRDRLDLVLTVFLKPRKRAVLEFRYDGEDGPLERGECGIIEWYPVPPAVRE